MSSNDLQSILARHNLKGINVANFSPSQPSPTPSRPQPYTYPAPAPTQPNPRQYVYGSAMSASPSFQWPAPLPKQQRYTIDPRHFSYDVWGKAPVYFLNGEDEDEEEEEDKEEDEDEGKGEGGQGEEGEEVQDDANTDDAVEKQAEQEPTGLDQEAGETKTSTTPEVELASADAAQETVPDAAAADTPSEPDPEPNPPQEESAHEVSPEPAAPSLTEETKASETPVAQDSHDVPAENPTADEKTSEDAASAGVAEAQDSSVPDADVGEGSQTTALDESAAVESGKVDTDALESPPQDCPDAVSSGTEPLDQDTIPEQPPEDDQIVETVEASQAPPGQHIDTPPASEPADVAPQTESVTALTEKPNELIQIIDPSSPSDSIQIINVSGEPTTPDDTITLVNPPSPTPDAISPPPPPPPPPIHHVTIAEPTKPSKHTSKKKTSKSSRQKDIKPIEIIPIREGKVKTGTKSKKAKKVRGKSGKLDGLPALRFEKGGDVLPPAPSPPIVEEGEGMLGVGDEGGGALSSDEIAPPPPPPPPPPMLDISEDAVADAAPVESSPGLVAEQAEVSKPEAIGIPEEKKENNFVPADDAPGSEVQATAPLTEETAIEGTADIVKDEAPSLQSAPDIAPADEDPESIVIELSNPSEQNSASTEDSSAVLSSHPGSSVGAPDENPTPAAFETEKTASYIQELEQKPLTSGHAKDTAEASTSPTVKSDLVEEQVPDALAPTTAGAEIDIVESIEHDTAFSTSAQKSVAPETAVVFGEPSLKEMEGVAKSGFPDGSIDSEVTAEPMPTLMQLAALVLPAERNAALEEERATITTAVDASNAAFGAEAVDTAAGDDVSDIVVQASESNAVVLVVQPDGVATDAVLADVPPEAPMPPGFDLEHEDGEDIYKVSNQQAVNASENVVTAEQNEQADANHGDGLSAIGVDTDAPMVSGESEESQLEQDVTSAENTQRTESDKGTSDSTAELIPAASTNEIQADGKEAPEPTESEHCALDDTPEVQEKFDEPLPTDGLPTTVDEIEAPTSPDMREEVQADSVDAPASTEETAATRENEQDIVVTEEPGVSTQNDKTAERTGDVQSPEDSVDAAEYTSQAERVEDSGTKPATEAPVSVAAVVAGDAADSSPVTDPTTHGSGAAEPASELASEASPEQPSVTLPESIESTEKEGQSEQPTENISKEPDDASLATQEAVFDATEEADRPSIEHAVEDVVQVIEAAETAQDTAAEGHVDSEIKEATDSVPSAPALEETAHSNVETRPQEPIIPATEATEATDMESAPSPALGPPSVPADPESAPSAQDVGDLPSLAPDDSISQQGEPDYIAASEPPAQEEPPAESVPEFVETKKEAGPTYASEPAALPTVSFDEPPAPSAPKDNPSPSREKRKSSHRHPTTRHKVKDLARPTSDAKPPSQTRRRTSISISNPKSSRQAAEAAEQEAIKRRAADLAAREKELRRREERARKAAELEMRERKLREREEKLVRLEAERIAREEEERERKRAERRERRRREQERLEREEALRAEDEERIRQERRRRRHAERESEYRRRGDDRPRARRSSTAEQPREPSPDSKPWVRRYRTEELATERPRAEVDVAEEDASKRPSMSSRRFESEKHHHRSRRDVKKHAEPKGFFGSLKKALTGH